MKLQHLLCFVFTCMSQAVTASDNATERHQQYDEEIAHCSPHVHSDTMKALIGVESQWHQFALADAGKKGVPWKIRKRSVKSYFFDNEIDAKAKARELLADGHTVSFGLTQINDQNLDALGLSIDNVFDVCLNLMGGERILVTYYASALKRFGNSPRALEAALSRYNSGDWYRGQKDGYVDLVYRQALKSGIQKATTNPRSATTLSTEQDDNRLVVEHFYQ